MSTRLDLALRELADAAADTSTFGDPDTSATVLTVHRLAGRVRRRRAARGAGTAAVAASVAGAAALVVPQLTQDVTPAGDPDADPGACRSAVTRIPSGPKEELGVELGYQSVSPPRIDTAADGQDLGTWQGSSADLVVSISQIPEAGVGATRLRLMLTEEGVVVGAAQELMSVTPTTTGEVLRTQLGDTVASAADPPAVYPLEDAEDRWWQTAETSTGALRVAQNTTLGFTACDGSGQLPPGTYQLYATTVDAVGIARGAAGPWDLEIVQDDPTRHQLPDGFPDEVPLVDGRLVAAHRHGAGWAAEIVSPGQDRAAVATALLAEAARDADDTGTSARSALSPPYDALSSGTPVALPGWSVRAVASQTPGGELSVVYVLMPQG
ncbi:hypothetical protein [Cellulomonas dongxiuzhuiae]|uniref:hypothetical protein n=1 Tax=Cellulomonas dongxiuzhuiae TaxID=2819979 RepID=UPI001AAF77CD|nr:hypothetical protein [Cellulomonas dongxiuzhuiae]MBO3088353.1 hypothetical protein [Cellulomonas dongxiuzhuiae]